MLLLFLVMGFGFSGYLLPWNTLAFFATKVGTEMAGQVPIVGKPMMIFLRGGEEVPGATLTRFFGFHVAVLPGISNPAARCFTSCWCSVLGMSVPPKLEAAVELRTRPRREMTFLPNFLLREMMAWYVALGVLGGLAAIFPWELGVKADPFAAGAGGNQAGMVFPVHVPDAEAHPLASVVRGRRGPGYCCFRLGGLLWLLLPFFERDQPRAGRGGSPGSQFLLLRMWQG